MFYSHFFQVYYRSEEVLQLCPQRETCKDKSTIEDAVFDPDNETINDEGPRSRLGRAAGTCGTSHKVWS